MCRNWRQRLAHPSGVTVTATVPSAGIIASSSTAYRYTPPNTAAETPVPVLSTVNKLAVYKRGFVLGQGSACNRNLKSNIGTTQAIAQQTNRANVSRFALSVCLLKRNHSAGGTTHYFNHTSVKRADCHLQRSSDETDESAHVSVCGCNICIYRNVFQLGNGVYAETPFPWHLYTSPLTQRRHYIIARFSNHQNK